MPRLFSQLSSRRRGLLAIVAALCAVWLPVVTINFSVMLLGRTIFWPFAIQRLDSRVEALRIYYAHWKICRFGDHPDLAPIAASVETRLALPSGLLQALIEVESESQAHRISWAGAMGPGQLMPGTAKQLGVVDPFDPETAIDGAGRYLAEQLRRFKSVELAVAAYNAGPGSVRGAVPQNGETEYYVSRVVAEYQRRLVAGATP